MDTKRHKCNLWQRKLYIILHACTRIVAFMSHRFSVSKFPTEQIAVQAQYGATVDSTHFFIELEDTLRNMQLFMCVWLCS